LMIFRRRLGIREREGERGGVSPPREREGGCLWGYAPAHTTTTPHDPPHATIPHATQRNGSRSVLRVLFIILKI
jgi:hypothetical protein